MTPNDPTSYMSYAYQNSYTLKEITIFVMQDMEAMNRDVRPINSLDQLCDGEYAVALKTSSMLVPGADFADYHFAVLLSDGTWADKCGGQPSRWNEIDGLADAWDLGYPYNVDGYYDSDTQLFAVYIGR